MSQLEDDRKTLLSCIQGIDAVRTVLHDYLRKATEPRSADNLDGPRDDVAEKLIVALASVATLRVEVREAFASFGVRPV